MTIAELFVNIGFKGGNSANKALKEVKTGLGEVKSTSLEAKAAILGVIYGLEKLMSASMKQGTELTNFNALTGLSAQRLQEWQYAARQAGVASEEFTGSIKGVQNSITNMLMGKSGIEGYAIVANKVGLDRSRLRDTFYVMEQLQKFAKAAPPDVGNQMLKSFGLSEGTIAAMRRNAFNPATMAKAPKYSEGETKQLAKVDAAWANLGNKIQMAMGHFTSKHGMQMVNDISKITDSVIRLTESLVRMAESLKVFTLLGNIVKWTNELLSPEGGLAQVAKGMDSDDKSRGHRLMDVFPNFFDEKGNTKWDKVKDLVPFMKGDSSSGSQQNINNNINMNFQHDGKDHKKTGDSVKKAIQDSYRQMSAQGQGS